MPKPNDYQNEDEWMGVCVPQMMRDNDGMENEQAVAACMNMWREKDKKKESEASMNFIFTELSNNPKDIKSIDGLAAGTFTSFAGEEVAFPVSDLQAYVANTQKIIESTKTEKGEIVGLPIDEDKHDHRGGAGWIVGLELDQTRNIIKFLVKWTEKGVDLISKNVRRFFSPSVDVENKVILGGSMTNWPATRGVNGEMLLRPVELSKTMKEIDMPKTIEDVLKELDDLKTRNTELSAKVTELSSKPKPKGDPKDTITPEMAEFIAGQEGAEEIGKEAQELAQNFIRDAQRKQHVKEFVSKVVGGTPERPFGIPVKASAIVAALLSMPDKQREFMENLILKLYDGAIDYAERGVNSSEFAQGKSVPAEYRAALKMWVEAGNPAATWFEEVGKDLGMGDPKDYNLREFAVKEKE